MDQRLLERLKKIDEQIMTMRTAEGNFLYLEAHSKVLFSKLFLATPPKSIEERKALVHASQDWFDFIRAHVDAETEFLAQRRKYELKLKAYDAEHLTLKTEAPAIKRQL